MLTERQELILSAIVQDYTQFGTPVGSKALVNQLPFHVSSATIRNEMVVLENQGLIEKTHLSSGRVPSINGYRYYVDHLTLPKVRMTNDLAMIHKALDIKYHQVDEFVQQSTDILSELTNYTTLTLQPEQSQSRRLHGFRFVSLGNHRGMAILVTDNGDTETETFRFPPEILPAHLEALVDWINEQLSGQPLALVLSRLETLDSVKGSSLYFPPSFIDVLAGLLLKATQARTYVGGELNLLNFTAQSDLSYLKSLYAMLGQSGEIAKFIGNPSSGVSVQIGSEMRNDLLKNYSVITGTYDVGQYGHGIIAVLGPTRMPYSKVIPLVSAFREELTNRLVGYYQ